MIHDANNGQHVVHGVHEMNFLCLSSSFAINIDKGSVVAYELLFTSQTFKNYSTTYARKADLCSLTALLSP